MIELLESNVLMLATTVKIIEPNIIGSIDAIILEKTGLMYRVMWWKDECKKSIWCNPEELMVVK